MTYQRDSAPILSLATHFAFFFYPLFVQRTHATRSQGRAEIVTSGGQLFGWSGEFDSVAALPAGRPYADASVAKHSVRLSEEFFYFNPF